MNSPCHVGGVRGKTARRRMRRVKSPFGGFGRPVSSTFFLRCSFENQFKDTSGVDPVAGTNHFRCSVPAFGSHF